MRYEQDNTSEGSAINNHLPVVRAIAQTEMRPGFEEPKPKNSPAPAHGFDLYALIRRSLRGRYGLAIGLSALGLIAGSLGGWFFESPEYKSEGLVRTAY